MKYWMLVNNSPTQYGTLRELAEDMHKRKLSFSLIARSAVTDGRICYAAGVIGREADPLNSERDFNSKEIAEVSSMLVRMDLTCGKPHDIMVES